MLIYFSLHIWSFTFSHYDLFADTMYTETFLGEQLTFQHKIGNVADRYDITVKKDTGKTVEYLPKKISEYAACFFSMVLQL